MSPQVQASSPSVTGEGKASVACGSKKVPDWYQEKFVWRWSTMRTMNSLYKLIFGITCLGLQVKVLTTRAWCNVISHRAVISRREFLDCSWFPVRFKSAGKHGFSTTCGRGCWWMLCLGSSSRKLLAIWAMAWSYAFWLSLACRAGANRGKQHWVLMVKPRPTGIDR